ncbi:MAG: YeeE/YedE family protein [Gammaproteobacteria bacterium]
MTSFTPYSALAGGLLIGLAATWLLLFNGRIAGISGIINGLFSNRSDRSWRAAFLVSMIVSAALIFHYTPVQFAARTDFPIGALILAGVLVGLGTRLGSGCTSGHGICGIGRLSRRSIVATACFFSVGVITALVSRHLLGVG